MINRSSEPGRDDLVVSQPGWPAEAGTMWSGTPLRSIVELFGTVAQANPDEASIVFDDGVSVTRGELAAAVATFAGHLASRLVPGDRVAVAIGNRAEFFVAWLGIIAARGVAVQMNPASGAHDATHVLSDSAARFAVADSSAAPVLRSVVADCPALDEVFCVDEDAPEPSGLGRYDDGDPIDLASHRAHPNQPTSIYYTSGTTGPPKGCISNHAGLIRYIDLIQRLYPLGKHDRLLNPLQFFYGDAIWLFLAGLCADAEMVSMRRFSVSRFWTVAKDHGATVLLSIGAIPSLLLTAPESPLDRDHSVRLALQIGVPPHQHAELVQRFGFPWIELYGQAESGLTIGMPLSLTDKYVGTGAIGIPMPEVEVRLVDEQGSTVTGEGAGELHVRAPFMMQEYLGRPEETIETIGSDGWLRTGDRGHRDANGVHYFLGRKKEIIRRGGENIAPFEVESVLRTHPLVIDAAVVPVPDDLRGEEVKAYVEVSPSSDLTAQELIEFSSGRLAPHKIPRYFEFRTAPFPRTPSHRIRKTELMVDTRHLTSTAWDREARTS